MLAKLRRCEDKALIKLAQEGRLVYIGKHRTAKGRKWIENTVRVDGYAKSIGKPCTCLIVCFCMNIKSLQKRVAEGKIYVEVQP